MKKNLQNTKRKRLIRVCAAWSLCAWLAACGGGGSGGTGGDPQVAVQSNDNASAAVLQLASDQPVATAQDASTTSKNAQQLFSTMPQSPDVVDAPAVSADLAGQWQALVQQQSAASASGPRALRLAATTPVAPPAPVGSASNPIGGSSAAIAPAVAACASVSVGYVYNATTQAAGTAQCYQFVVGASTSKIDTQVLLPAGVSAQTYLFYVSPSTGQLTTVLDTDNSPRNPQLLQAIAQNARMVMVLVPSNGSGGQTFQFLLANRPGYDAYEINDKPATATPVVMNNTINASLDVPGVDQDYYFYPLNPGQTSAEVMVTFSPSQSASVRLAQKLGANTYALYPETTIANADSGKVKAFGSLPGNVVGTSTPYGLMVRVSSIFNGAVVKEPYSLRVGITTTHIKTFSVASVEQPYQVNYSLTPNPVGPHMGITIGVVDDNDQPIAGEYVKIRVINANDGSVINEYSDITTANGYVFYQPSIAINFCGIYPYNAPYLYYGNGGYANLLITAQLSGSVYANVSYSMPSWQFFANTQKYGLIGTSVQMMCNTFGQY